MPGGLQPTGKPANTCKQIYGSKDHQAPSMTPKPESKNPIKTKIKYSEPILICEFYEVWVNVTGIRADAAVTDQFIHDFDDRLVDQQVRGKMRR